MIETRSKGSSNASTSSVEGGWLSRLASLLDRAAFVSFGLFFRFLGSIAAESGRGCREELATCEKEPSSSLISMMWLGFLILEVEMRVSAVEN